jgi:hypothetical protein
MWIQTEELVDDVYVNYLQHDQEWAEISVWKKIKLIG